MVLLQRLVIAGGIAFLAAAAHAADMPRLPPPIEPPIEKPVPVLRDIFLTGWYLRGDVGYRWDRASRVTSVTGTNLTDSNFGKDYTVGGGAGFRSRWFRTDLTVDYATGFNYTGTFLAPGDTTAKIQSTTVLLNGYADLGTWYRLTPYVGVGAGGANVHLSGLTSPGFNGPTSSTRWNFAWAAMAGVGWTVARNMVIDFGYRYLSAGDVKSESGTTGNVTFKNVYAHELRLGLRWSFDDLYGDR